MEYSGIMQAERRARRAEDAGNTIRFDFLY